MCDNIDALLADEGGIDGDYDIRAEDEEALLEEDNYDDQNIVSSSNRNYYASREELEEEELDHEPEEPEDILELDENVSDLPDEEANESLNKSVNQREKRDTKFVSERNLPLKNSSLANSAKHNNYNNPNIRPQQQNFHRNTNFNSRGVRGGRFRGRGRGNVGNRPDLGKKVLINPHFPGNVPFNNQARPPWHNNANAGNNAGRVQPWIQGNQRMQPFQQQIHQPNNQFVHQQQQQMEHNQMVHAPQQQQYKPPVHQRLGNPNPSPDPPYIDHRAPFHHHPQQQNYPPPHIYQPPPANNPPQHTAFPQYNQPPPIVQSQASYTLNMPPPYVSAHAHHGQVFSSPPPGYTTPSSAYEQSQSGVYVPQQQQQHQQQGGFEFQPPPPQQQPQIQMHSQEMQQYQQQQIVYQQEMPPPMYQQPEYQPPTDPQIHYNPNAIQYIQNAPQIQQERRVFAPRATAQNRLGPPAHNQQQPRQGHQQQQQQQQSGRFVVNRGGGNVLNRGGVYNNRGGLMVSPGKRRYPLMDGEGGIERRRRTAEITNLQEVPRVDSTTTANSRIAPALAVIDQQVEIEEDEETRIYRKKIENQKKIREKILAQKEQRRKQAAMRTAAEKGLASLKPPSEIVAQLIPETQSAIKTIITQNTNQNVNVNRRIIKTSNLSARIVNKPVDQSASVSHPTTTNKDEISSFLTNRRIIAKDQSLPSTSIVVVSNLAAGTSEVRLRKLCQGVGDVQKLEMRPSERQATIQFKSIASAHAFFKKYQRYMIDLSMINVVLKI